MTQRLRVAVCLALIFTGSAVAQGPDGPPVVPPPCVGDCGVPCDLGQGFWVSAAYTQGWINGTTLPALVTTSPAGTARAAAGVLGAPGTTTLFGGRVNDDSRFGLSLGAGYLFDPATDLGVEAGFSVLESQAAGFSATSDAGAPILARPFVNAVTGAPEAVLIAFPGSSGGSVEVRAASGNFYDFRLDFTETFCDTGRLRLDAIVGYRLLRYDEGVRVRQTILPTDPTFVPGTRITTVDDFGSQNEFHAADVGVRARFTWDRLSLGLLAKVAVGRLEREVNIEGSQVTTVPGTPPVTQPGGFLALASNSGLFRSGSWTAAPELGASLSWEVSRAVRLHLSYSALDFRQVARAGDQIDPVLNRNLFPPVADPSADPARPAFPSLETDIWIQRVNFGVEFSF